MIVTYLDTSALMRLVPREGELAMVQQAMQATPATLVLTQLELHSAISRRWHDGVFSMRTRDSLLATIATQILSAVTLLPLDEEVLREAQHVVATYRVRTLDALHLATAIICQRYPQRNGDSVRFCTADRRQAEAGSAIFGAERVMLVPPLR